VVIGGSVEFFVVRTEQNPDDRSQFQPGNVMEKRLNLMKKEALIVERGKVIAAFVEIERIVDWIVQTVLFRGDPPLWFSRDLLANEHYSFALRMSLFERTITDFDGQELLPKRSRDKVVGDVRRMGVIRNIFAHAGHKWGHGDVADLYVHPKKPTLDPLDWSDLLQEFDACREDTEPVLGDLASRVSERYEM
jgi:hypothetical protein